ncbi:MAG TPA: BON domain-containing protein [Thermoanaerobaculia bacterium]|nr:BON domain-containing protein [Thermoanaerobaculia bacterium]
MKRNQWILAVGLALMAVVTMACSTATPHNNVDQAAIEANIRSQIATHYPGETFDISIEVAENGTVTLGNKVDDNDKRTRIAEIARNTPGVTRVVNNITVGE